MYNSSVYDSNTSECFYTAIRVSQKLLPLPYPQDKTPQSITSASRHRGLLSSNTPNLACGKGVWGSSNFSRHSRNSRLNTPLSLPYRRSSCSPAGSQGGRFSCARRCYDRRAKRQRQPPLVLSSWVSFLEDDSCVRTTGRIKVYLTLPLPHFLPAWQGRAGQGKAGVLIGGR